MPKKPEPEILDPELAGEWLTKQQAARVLGCSERTIENYIADRSLSSKPQPRPGKRPLTVVDPADVERLKAEQNRGAILRDEPERPLPAQLSIVPAIPQIPQLAEAVLERLRREQPKPFLTLPEAAERSGLPVGLLRRFVRDGRLKSARLSGKIWVKLSDVEGLELDSGQSRNDSANRATKAAGSAGGSQ